MNTIKRSIAAVFCIAICAVASAQTSWYTQNWMSNIPDSTYVCSLSIPGTHDSCTEGVLMVSDKWAKTQTLTLSEQFKQGIRVFDIRPAIVNIEVFDIEILRELYIFHGPEPCGIAFDTVVSTFKDLLTEFPSEFIIMIVNVENNFLFSTDESQKMVAEKERAFIGDSKFVQEFRPDLTVGDIRGKILIINRDGLGAKGTSPLPAAFFNGWGGLPSKGTITSGARAGAGGTNPAKFFDQDVDNYVRDYEFMEEKFKHFKRTADQYYADKDYFSWCFNMASAWCGESALTMDYNENANKMNAYLANEYLPNEEKFHVKGAWRGVGMVLMDYAATKEFNGKEVYGFELIRSIINLNFDKVKPSPSL